MHRFGKFKKLIDRLRRIPMQKHSDQGRSFESDVFRKMCRLLGIEKTIGKFVWIDSFLYNIGPNDRLKKSGVVIEIRIEMYKTFGTPRQIPSL